MKKHKNIGSRFDEFLAEDEILDHAESVAIKRTVAFQIQEEMKKMKLTKTMLAKKMKTSRSSLDRLLDPDDEAITVKTLKRAAKSLGKRVEIRLV